MKVLLSGTDATNEFERILSLPEAEAKVAFKSFVSRVVGNPYRWFTPFYSHFHPNSQMVGHFQRKDLLEKTQQ